MNLDLLKNNVYLTLLAFYNYGRIDSYEKIGEKCGISRQTASKRVKQLIDKGLVSIDDKKIITVKNELNIDVWLLQKVLHHFLPNINATQLEKVLFPNSELGTIQNNPYDFLEQNVIIYGIVSEGVIKYINSTENYEEKIKEHILKKPFLTFNNFIILSQTNKFDKFTQEKELIHIIQPEWNVMNKEF